MIIHFENSKFFLVGSEEHNFLMNEVKKLEFHIVADDRLIINWNMNNFQTWFFKSHNNKSNESDNYRLFPGSSGGFDVSEAHGATG